MKTRSSGLQVADSPALIEAPDLIGEPALNVVIGQLRDAEGNFLPEGTVLTLWGESFTVGKDGAFTSPALPESASEAEILVQLPGGSNITSFTAPFVSDVVPVFVELKVGAADDGNHAPTVVVSASVAGKAVCKINPGTVVTLLAVGSDANSDDQAALVPTWSATSGTLADGASAFEKRWTAPDYFTVATITVEVKDPQNATGKAQLPILVGIDNPSQVDTVRPTVALTADKESVTDSAAFNVTITFNEPVNGFEVGDLSFANATLSEFSTVTARKVFRVKVTPQAAGEVKISVAESVATDLSNNKNTASNILTLNNSITPVKSSEKAITAFSFPALSVTGAINNTNKTISVTVPFGTNVSALVANFTASAKASVKVGETSQVSGTTANDFSSAAVYNVTAEDGSNVNYTVTVTITLPTQITALDLSSLVTAPVKGAAPVTTAIDQTQYTSGLIGWYEADGTTAVAGNFAAAKVYVAKLTLSAKAGYTLSGVAANSFTYTGATSVANAENAGAVTITFAPTDDAVVDALDLSSLVTSPVKGAAPVTTAINQAQYTSGAIGWFEADGTTAVTGNFAAAKVYVAKLTLSAKAGYTLTGVAENSFAYTGATSVANAVNSGNITITFGATDATIINIAAVPGVTAPVTGATPVTNITETAQYTGTVSWSPDYGTFAADTVYTATVNLTPKAGFTLAGVGANFFTVAGATATNGANSGVVSAVFGGTDVTVDIAAVAGVTAPVTGATPITTVTETAQYTGTVNWLPAHVTFAADTVYTATVTLAPKAGFTLAGVGANFFTVAGATATNGANSGAISAVFGGTDATINIAAVAGVTAPVTGATPVTAITETAQYTGTVSWSPAHGTFAADTVYTATVTLMPKTGFTLAGVGANFFTVADATTTNGANSGAISAVFGGTAATINIAAVPGVTAPVTGATPVTTITETAQYTGTVSWSPAHGTFAADTVYTATVTLTPKAGFTLAGVGANFFTVAGSTATNAANSGTVSAVFGGTDATVDIAAVAGVTAPVTGATPVTAITETAQYTGTVSWSPAHGTFAADTVYTATVTLAPKTGFTLAGVGANFFTVAGATATNGANSGTVSAVFGGTAATINIAVVPGVTAPVTGATPVTTITETAQYTGTVSWSPAHGTFAAGTVYTATVTLTPKAGFTLVGVAANFFTVAGGTSTNAASSGLVSVVFAATTEPVTAIGEVSGVPMDGQTLTAGAVTPGGATVGYRWQVSNDGVNGWNDISGANSNTYAVNLANSAVGDYVRVVATGNGSYGGEVFSAAEKIQGMPTMVSVPAGTFQRDANAANTSFVSAFSMSAHEITRAQFARFMGTDPTDATYSSGRADPVQMVNWYHAIAFCNKLSIAEGLPPVYTIGGSTDPAVWGAVPLSDNSTWNAAVCSWSANGYRLPTEMEWMWAAMGAPADGQNGGTNASGYSKAFAGSDGSNSLDAYAWYTTNSNSKTHPVGTKLANELGLSDMSGNIREWCWDYSDNGTWPNYAISGVHSDYRGAGTGSSRVIRGGGWNAIGVPLAVANRSYTNPNVQGYYSGFRVARSVIVPVTDIGGISGTPKSGQTLTAGALTPGYAAVDYQWQVSDDGSSGWSNISGETANTYIVDLAETAVGKYVRVTATGKDSYSGTVYSSALNIWGDYNSANIGTLKYVPAGSFQRDWNADNVSSVSSFRMSQYEITRAQFKGMFGNMDPSFLTGSSGNGDPVQMVNWYHAIAFCNKLSLAEGLTPVYAVSGVDFSSLTYAAIPTSENESWNAATCNWSANGYRLPTEMEWMWAAMGADLDSYPDSMSEGVNFRGFFKSFAGYNGSNSINSYAWYGFYNSGSATAERTDAVGNGRAANELGLYDMSGNVWEWCWDWFDGSTCLGSNVDYKGPLAGFTRIQCGGSWQNDNVSVNSRAAYGLPFLGDSVAGFRVVRP